MRQTTVYIKNGGCFTGDCFDEVDFDKIKAIFKKWMEINNELKSLGGRTLNVPDVISEAIYCHFFNAARTNGTAYSYDAVDLTDGAGIQIKSASIPNDLTSFGPKSTWDKLIFMDFAPNGKLDGNINIYEITQDVSGIIMNKGKNETFADQQAQGRRPRFSIKSEIIEKYGLKPIKSVNLLS